MKRNLTLKSKWLKLQSLMKIETIKTEIKALLQKKPTFTTLIFILGACVFVIYLILGYLRFTDNGFVVQVSTPMAPRVSGLVTVVHVKNGQAVKMGDPLVSLDPANFQLTYEGAKSQYQKALLAIKSSEKKVDLTGHKLKAAIADLNILRNQYKSKNNPSVKDGIPAIELFDLKNKVDAQANAVESIRDQLEIDKLDAESAKENAESLKAVMQTAKLSLDYTIVRAPSDGHVENIFLGIGSHVSPSAAMFTLINDGHTYVQANFEETELAGVKEGNKVTVYPRTYMGKKTFEGTVVSIPLGVARQTNQLFSGVPIVQTENKWLLLPQRLPVIVQITNPDKNYPLINGMSTYVRLQH